MSQWTNTAAAALPLAPAAGAALRAQHRPAAGAPSAPPGPLNERRSMTAHASGTFEVQLKPMDYDLPAPAGRGAP